MALINVYRQFFKFIASFDSDFSLVALDLAGHWASELVQLVAFIIYGIMF